MIDSIHWVFNGLNLGVESRFLYLYPLNPKLSADGKGNPSDLDSLRDAGLTAALGAHQGHGLSYPAQLARPPCS